MESSEPHTSKEETEQAFVENTPCLPHEMDGAQGYEKFTVLPQLKQKIKRCCFGSIYSPCQGYEM